MGVGYCFTKRMGRIYQIQLAADKALVQRHFFNMFAARPFGKTTRQKYRNFGLCKKKETNFAQVYHKPRFASDLHKICFR